MQSYVRRLSIHSCNLYWFRISIDFNCPYNLRNWKKIWLKLCSKCNLLNYLFFKCRTSSACLFVLWLNKFLSKSSAVFEIFQCHTAWRWPINWCNNCNFDFNVGSKFMWDKYVYEFPARFYYISIRGSTNFFKCRLALWSKSEILLWNKTITSKFWFKILKWLKCSTDSNKYSMASWYWNA